MTNLSIQVIRIITRTGIAGYPPKKRIGGLSSDLIDIIDLSGFAQTGRQLGGSGTGVAHIRRAPLNTCHLGEEKDINEE
jgi:hypothetical protein